MNTLIFDNEPIVSVILCTFNRAEYLKQCIESVLAQTYLNWELIIVDDGSSDDTYNIVNDYLMQNANFRYIKHKNKKLALSRNIGIMASFGKYITFIDSDDLYLPNHLAYRVDYMEQNPQIDIIEGGIKLEKDFFVVDYFQPDKLIYIKECVAGATFFGKRKVYFELNGYNCIHYGEDTDFWDRAKQRFFTEKLKNAETYIYSRTEKSITNDLMNKLLETKKSPLIE